MALLFHRMVITAIIATTFAMPAFSQSNAVPKGPQSGLGGPVISGVCLMSREAVLVNSSAGKAATARLQQLTLAAQTEVEEQRKPVAAEAEAFAKAQAKLTAEQRTQREQTLAQKVQTVQALADLRGREIEATRNKAIDRISIEAQTAIAEVYAKKKCGLLIDRNSVLGGNMSNDITADVVASLDSKLPTVTFERETLAQGQ